MIFNVKEEGVGEKLEKRKMISRNEFEGRKLRERKKKTIVKKRKKREMRSS